MALSATLYRCKIDISNTDTGCYQSSQQQLAQHPSETIERMLARLLVWSCCGPDSLQFCKGISNQEEPDLWEKSLDGQILRWVEVGEPDPERVRKACLKARQVDVFSFTSKKNVWWHKNQNELESFSKGHYFQLDTSALTTLANQLPRNFSWQVTVTEGQIYIHDDRDQLVTTEILSLK